MMIEMQTPDDSYTALLLQYAAGSLDQAQRLVVATHLSLSPPARKIVRRYETLGGAIMAQCCDPAEMSARSLDRVMAQLEARAPQPQEKPQAPRTMMIGDLAVPEILYNALQEHARAELRWRRMLEGMQSADLPIRCRRSRTRFVRLDPGFAAPPPRRRVTQITLVIKGAYSDETGTHQYGDLVITEAEEQVRRIEACHNQGCVNLTVSSSPQLHGLAALLYQLLK